MAVFTALTPLLTVALSAPLLKETPTVGMVGGGILSLLGLLYLVSAGDPAALARNGVHFGDPLMLLSALVYALYGVLLKRWNLPVVGWQSTYMQALCALVIMFPALLATPAPLRSLNAGTLPLVGYAGGLASVVLPFLWVRGVHILGPSRCAVFMNLLPVFTALGGDRPARGACTFIPYGWRWRGARGRSLRRHIPPSLARRVPCSARDRRMNGLALATEGSLHAPLGSRSPSTLCQGGRPSAARTGPAIPAHT